MRRRLLILVVVGLLTCAAAPAGADFAGVSAGGGHSPVAGGEAPSGFGKAAPVDGAGGQSINPTLLWGAAAGADSYEYCVDASDDDACAGWVDAGAATGAALRGLSPDTAYFWQVRATNAFGTTFADGGAFWGFATLAPGIIASWGRDDHGEVSGKPAGGGFVALAAGGFHSAALRADGSIAAWGSDGMGQVSGTPAGTGFVAVAAGAHHNLALRADGSIAAWGWDGYGQVSGTPAGTGFVAVAASWYHSVALRADGSIAAWGSDGLGQVSGTPAGAGFVAVDAGGYHSVALRADGSIAAWGSDGHGEVSGTPAGAGFVAVAAGAYHNLALRADGSIVSWGWDPYGQVSGTPAGTGLVAVAAGAHHNLALRADGSLVSWGYDAYGQASGTPAGNDFGAVASGEDFNLALISGEPPGGFDKAAPGDGVVGQPINPTLLWGAAAGADSYEYCVDASDDDACAGWVGVGAATGAALRGLSPDTAYFWQVRATNAFGTTYADGGAFGEFATLSPGWISAWGYDNDGEVSGTPAGAGFVAVAAGYAHSVGLRADGSLVSWGYDGDGEVSGTPAGTGFVAVAAGGYHSVGLRADGSLVSWGYDGDGEVSGTPAGTGFVAVAAGGYHSVGLRADGSLVSWGYNSDGQVSGTPAGTGFVAVAAGWYHSVGLRADGSLVSWGRNTEGEVSGTPAGTGFVAVAAGRYHSVGLRADGSIASWGYDGDGEVSGTPAGTGFVGVAAGGYHSVGLRADGPLASWGSNAYGQVSGTPAGTGFVAVAAGGHHSLALVRAEAPGAFGKVAPADGADGQPLTLTLSWEAASGATSYEYCLDTTDDGACSGAWVSTGTATGTALSGLSPGTAYFWQARASNDFGTTYANGEAWWWEFTTVSTATFRSVAAGDGWVLEQDETSGKGGTFDAAAATGRLGDDALDRQYRAILDFDTSALPDDAVIVGITIRIKRQAITGTNPFSILGLLTVDMKTGYFHDNPALEKLDFHAMGSRGNVGRFIKTPAEGWYRAPLRAPSYLLVNLTGHTQFRLRFYTDDNDNGVADYLSFYAGDTPTLADRPELIITYYVPEQE